MDKPRRILIVRTDRMGDVILSTPVIRTLRRTFPDAYLGFMVQPAWRHLIEGHPDLNTVIVYDQNGIHKSCAATVRCASQLKQHHFDTALFLHSTNRVIWMGLLAGIPRRVGYARRMRWALTDSMPYLKKEGTQHELDYTLDLLKLIGVKEFLRELSISLNESNFGGNVDKFLHQYGVNERKMVYILHPGASCRSKRWAPDRFAQVGDSLMEKGGCVIVVTGSSEKEVGHEVIRLMKKPAVPALGQFHAGELALLLRKANCLISNDSGPVHLACAVGTPVVSIFGRWEGGLSPTRWGPTGEKSMVLHKDVGCRPCLAHRCPIGFVCLETITVGEVLAAVEAVTT